MNLVIVESLAKTKIIEKYLSEIADLGRFSVVASLGHITEIPVSRKGYDSKSWSVEYVPIESKKSVISMLKTKSRNVCENKGCVYIASDSDLEGEAIAWQLYLTLGLSPEKCKRVTFIEITKDAIRNAFMNPTVINLNKVNAQESRRVLDRVVGYEVSPLLWNNFANIPNANTLSAGRVQSAALKLVVDRYIANREFVPETYYTVNGVFNIKGISYPLIAVSDKFKSKPDINSNKTQTEFNIEINKKERHVTPSKPYRTSTIQRDAYKFFNMNAKTTMQVCQQLYEAGHITYMRTD